MVGVFFIRRLLRLENKSKHCIVHRARHALSILMRICSTFYSLKQGFDYGLLHVFTIFPEIFKNDDSHSTETTTGCVFAGGEILSIHWKPKLKDPQDLCP